MGERSKWIVEFIGRGEVHSHAVRQSIIKMMSGNDDILVVETAYGRSLVKNDRLQSTEMDEWIYHEALVHPAMIAHPNPRTVLCVAGTTGAIVREILRHPCVEEVAVVGVDMDVVDALEAHLPYTNRAVFYDSRVRCINNKDIREVNFGKEKFDVVIADLPEPTESNIPDTDLFKTAIDVFPMLLSEVSVLGIAGGAVHPIVDSFSTLPDNLRSVKRRFSSVSVGSVSVPSLGIPWGMLFCSSSLNLAMLDAKIVNDKLRGRNISGLRFYDGETQIGMFSLPRHIRSWLNGAEPGAQSAHIHI